jgi:hypothetical protein
MKDSILNFTEFRACWLWCRYIPQSHRLSPVDYLLYDAYSRHWDTLQHEKALASQMGTVRTHSTFRIYLAADSKLVFVCFNTHPRQRAWAEKGVQEVWWRLSQSGKSVFSLLTWLLLSLLYTLRQPVSSASMAKRLLHSISGDEEGEATWGIRGCRVSRRGGKGDLMGYLIGPGNFKLAARLPIQSTGLKMK